MSASAAAEEMAHANEYGGAGASQWLSTAENIHNNLDSINNQNTAKHKATSHCRRHIYDR